MRHHSVRGSSLGCMELSSLRVGAGLHAAAGTYAACVHVNWVQQFLVRCVACYATSCLTPPLPPPPAHFAAAKSPIHYARTATVPPAGTAVTTPCVSTHTDTSAQECNKLGPAKPDADGDWTCHGASVALESLQPLPDATCKRHVRPSSLQCSIRSQLAVEHTVQCLISFSYGYNAHDYGGARCTSHARITIFSSLDCRGTYRWGPKLGPWRFLNTSLDRPLS